MKNESTIFMVRHGETDWNVQKRIQGHTDNPLNTQGERQARELRDSFQGTIFASAHSSPLIRAVRTAEIIMDRDNAIQINPGLIERNYGPYEGVPHRVMGEVNRHIALLPQNERLRHKPHPDFETDGEIIDRIEPVIRGILGRHHNEKILVTSHGGVMRVVLLYLHHITETVFPQISNTAVIQLKGDFNMVEIADMHGITIEERES